MPAIRNSDAAVFAMPGGESPGFAKNRPVDLAHLSRQTMGDRELEREVLQLFIQQANSVRDRIGGASPKERALLAHSLKGSARGVGAFPIAECAGRIEDSPADRQAIRRLGDLVDEVREFIAAISR